MLVIGQSTWPTKSYISRYLFMVEIYNHEIYCQDENNNSNKVLITRISKTLKAVTQRMAEQQTTDNLIEFALTSQGKQINITPTTNQRHILR